VMPQIRDLFEDQWEDHWWPQSLPDSDMADYGERSELAAE